MLKKQHFSAGQYKFFIFNMLRGTSLLGLAWLAGQFQLVDSLSNIKFNGVAIMLSLDVSASMELIDDRSDPRKRIDVAKLEAKNFVQKRLHDEIGILVFGTDFLTLSLTTLDKSFLTSIIDKININEIINGNSTALGKGLGAAVLRLKDHPAKSKIIILLTDGKSTAEGDLPIPKSIAMAKEFGIKVYCVAVGSNRPFANTRFGQLIPIPGGDGAFDEKILREIAEATGGKYFHAKNPAEMKQAYDTIDKLEKSQHNSKIFEKCHNVYWPFVIIVIIALFLEIFLKTFIWKILEC